MAIFEGKEFRSLIKILEDANLQEGHATKDEIIKILADLRGVAKQHERTDQPLPPANFCNKVANDLWQVISWLQVLPSGEGHTQ